MRVAITGATGLVGGHLRRELDDVVVLTRNPERVAGDRAFAWDAEGEIAPVAALAGADVVVHLAGEPVASGRWTAARRARIQNSRWLGTANLVKALRVAEPRPSVLVSASAIGYYGDRGDQVLAEDAGPGTGFLAEVVAGWEREALAAEELGMRVVCLRIGVVLANEGGALPRMAMPMRAGVGGRLGNGRQWMAWIHVADLVRLLQFASEHQELRGPVNAVAPQPATNSQVTAALGRALHRPTFLPVPKLALRLLFGKMSETLLASQRVIPRLAREAGFQFRFADVDAAVTDLLG